ncbi:reverse transcriptase domain-containing protein [Tanacetum coccineum]
MSDNIPFEIQMEIIKKVSDVESLIRFRSVSKEWKCFIDSPQCIAGYNVRLSQPHRLILRYIDMDSYEEKYVTFLDDNDTFTQLHDSPPTVPDLIKQLEDFSKVVGSSHGLWCLYGNTDSGKRMVVLWNPSIRKSIGIVVPYVFSGPPYKTTVFGFGVCPVTCDPTIVKISYADRNDMDSIPWQVEIFTLSSKRWEMIPSGNLPRQSIRLKSLTQVAIDRFIYWAAYDTIVGDDGVSHTKRMIMSFNLISKGFKVVDIPDSIINQFIGGWFFTSKLRESLILFGYIRENEMLEDAVCGVWMMVHDGGITSFRRIFTIDTPISSVNEILGFRKNGEPIIEALKMESQFATFEVYEPHSQHITNFGIYGEDWSFLLSSCMESMLLLDHADCSIY